MSTIDLLRRRPSGSLRPSGSRPCAVAAVVALLASVTLMVWPGQAGASVAAAPAPTMPDGTVGQTYRSPAPAIDLPADAAPFWISFDLPAGLWVHPDTGEVWGTPTEAVRDRRVTLLFKLADPYGWSDSVETTITVLPAIQASGRFGTATGGGTPYQSPTPTASGGVAPYTWSTSSPLPGGLRLDPSNGVIWGTTYYGVEGTYPITLVVTDATGATGEFSDNLTVVAARAPAMPDGTVGQPYWSPTPPIDGSLGKATDWFSWDLPAGLSVDFDTGEVSGTPTAAVVDLPVTFWFVPEVPDFHLRWVQTTITVFPAIQASGRFGTATEGTTYASLTPTASGGVGPYTWSTSSPLPSGLTLDPSTGVISGTADNGTDGTYPITLVATDSTGATGEFSDDLTVVPVSPSGPMVSLPGLGLSALIGLSWLSGMRWRRRRLAIS